MISYGYDFFNFLKDDLINELVLTGYAKHLFLNAYGVVTLECMTKFV